MFHIQDRNDFIAFACAIGGFARDQAKKDQTVIGFGGDFHSGKELLALGIDMAFRPENYPNGQVASTLNAERTLSDDFNRCGMVVFENFLYPVYLNREGFDKGLQQYKDQNPQARVLCYSNIERTLSGEHDFAKKGMNSDQLDISLRVYKMREFQGNGQGKIGFERTIIVNLQDNSPFAASIAQLWREERFAEPLTLISRLSVWRQNIKNNAKPEAP